MKKTMLKAMTLLFLLLPGIKVKAWNPPQGDEIVGRYQLPNQLVIEIFRSVDKQGGNEYEGKIVALNNFNEGQTNDVNNSDKKERMNPLLGKIIMEGLHYNSSEEQWVDGTMYAPDKGITINLKVISVNDSVAVAEGSKFLFSKSVNWMKLH
jgi:hypothetical protein